MNGSRTDIEQWLSDLDEQFGEDRRAQKRAREMVALKIIIWLIIFLLIVFSAMSGWPS